MTVAPVVEKALVAMDDQVLATSMALAFVGADAGAKPIEQAIDSACGTKTAE